MSVAARVGCPRGLGAGDEVTVGAAGLRPSQHEPLRAAEVQEESRRVRALLQIQCPQVVDGAAHEQRAEVPPQAHHGVLVHEALLPARRQALTDVQRVQDVLHGEQHGRRRR